MTLRVDIRRRNRTLKVKKTRNNGGLLGIVQIIKNIQNLEINKTIFSKMNKTLLSFRSRGFVHFACIGSEPPPYKILYVFSRPNEFIAEDTTLGKVGNVKGAKRRGTSEPLIFPALSSIIRIAMNAGELKTAV